MLTLTQPKDAHMLEEIYMSFRKHMRCFSEHMKIIQSPLGGFHKSTQKYYMPRFLLRKPASWQTAIKYNQRQETMARPYFCGVEYKVSFLRTYHRAAKVSVVSVSLSVIIPQTVIVLLDNSEKISGTWIMYRLLNWTMSNAVPTEIYRSQCAGGFSASKTNLQQREAGLWDLSRIFP